MTKILIPLITKNKSHLKKYPNCPNSLKLKKHINKMLIKRDNSLMKKDNSLMKKGNSQTKRNKKKINIYILSLH
jgi:hypothetical protein